MDDKTKQKYIKKREFLIKALTNLQGHWSKADQMLTLVKSSKITPEVIDKLVDSIKKASGQVKDDKKNKKLNETHDMLVKMQEEEDMEAEEERKKSEELLKQI